MRTNTPSPGPPLSPALASFMRVFWPDKLYVILVYPLTLVFAKASLVAQTVKRPPTMWETRVRSLDREDPLEKEIATHSNIHAWKVPWTKEPSGLQSTGSQLSDFTFTFVFAKT